MSKKPADQFVATGNPSGTLNRHEIVVIGAGQCGLSVGFHLSRLGVDFLIVASDERVGDPWRNRWDSLKLFTPAMFNGLDGLPFPARGDTYPTKDEMGDYLETYAEHFQLPIRLRTTVDALRKDDEGYVVMAGEQRFIAKQVVVAAASYQKPKVPSFASDLDPAILQLHSSGYRNPAQLSDGGVLVVGAGNSGAEIALELAAHRKVWLAGNSTGHLPFNINGLIWRRLFARPVSRGLFHYLLTVDNVIGRRVRPRILSRGAPLMRTHPRDLTRAGVERTAPIAGVKDGKPLLSEGGTIKAANVIWCTGFHPGLSWIELPIFDDDGKPKHQRGFVADQPGLFFVGLHFLYALSSTMIHGVGRDAKRVAEKAAEDAREKIAAPRADLEPLKE